jgi:hypothetical protein
MNIVPFIPRSGSQGVWQAEEMSQLLSIYAAHEAQGEAIDWDTGETERKEPQFYILGSHPEHDCVVSITRIGRDYILEDGQGRVVAEDSCLSSIADRAVRMTSGLRKSAFLARIALGWIAAREFFEEKIEPLMAEPVEVAAHFFPQLAAFA